jgi:predicted dehydrogenase
MKPEQIRDFSYLESSLPFKLRKVLRYVALDGVSKTLSKVRAQYHMAKTAGFEGPVWRNPACRSPDHPSRFVGIIGAGKFAHSMIGFYLKQLDSRFLRVAHDVNRARAMSLCRDYRGAYASDSAEEVISDPRVRLVYIASNHASHAEYAIRCLNAGKSVHIEKPQVISDDQLERLLDAQAKHPEVMVFLGFNRPRSPHFKRTKSALAAQTGPTMVNWFIAGHHIPDGNWYFSPGEGGRVLGNLCHWTDLTLCLVGVDAAFPCEVVPVCEPASKSDFCVGIKFNDGSLAGITFSAKGHTFEGVHEKLNAHRGDALVSITDFKKSTIEIVERKYRFATTYRDHGHRWNIWNSYIAVRDNERTRAVDMRYNKATARLFLGVKRAVDDGVPVWVTLD